MVEAGERSSLARRAAIVLEALAGPYRIATVAMTLLVVWLFFYLRDPNDVFLSARNLSNLTLQITVTGLLALGLVFVLLLGEIDLSVAALSGVAAAVTVALIQQNGWPTALAIVAGLAFGALFQVGQSLVVVFGAASFIVTLGGSLILTGLLLRILPPIGQFNLSGTTLGRLASTYIETPWAVTLTAAFLVVFAAMRFSTWRRQRHRGLDPSWMSFVRPVAAATAVSVAALMVFASYRGVPLPFAFFMAVLLVSSYSLTQTKFGTAVYAVGGNREAARRAGIKVTRIVILGFAIAGVLTAAGGIVAASRVLGVSNQSGSGTLLLQSIAAAVIGGVSLRGGRGSVWAALMGALVIGSISNGMDLLDYSTSAKNMVQGSLLIAAVAVDVTINRGSLRPSRGS